MTEHAHAWYGAGMRRIGWIHRRWIVIFACRCGKTMEGTLLT